MYCKYNDSRLNQTDISFDSKDSVMLASRRMDGKADRWTCGWSCRQRGGEAGTEAGREACREAGREAEREAGIEAGREAGRQRGRQTEVSFMNSQSDECDHTPWGHVMTRQDIALVFGDSRRDFLSFELMRTECAVSSDESNGHHGKAGGLKPQPWLPVSVQSSPPFFFQIELLSKAGRAPPFLGGELGRDGRLVVRREGIGGPPSARRSEWDTRCKIGRRAG